MKVYVEIKKLASERMQRLSGDIYTWAIYTDTLIILIGPKRDVGD